MSETSNQPKPHLLLGPLADHSTPADIATYMRVRGWPVAEGDITSRTFIREQSDCWVELTKIGATAQKPQFPSSDDLFDLGADVVIARHESMRPVRLRAAREMAQQTIEGLAPILGTRKKAIGKGSAIPTIHRFETGKSWPSDDVLYRLAHAYRVSPAWLHRGAPESESPGWLVPWAEALREAEIMCQCTQRDPMPWIRDWPEPIVFLRNFLDDPLNHRMVKEQPGQWTRLPHYADALLAIRRLRRRLLNDIPKWLHAGG